MRLRLLTPALALFCLASPVSAMDGTNVDTGDTFTVADDTTFNVGDTLAMFDADGNEMDVQIQAVNDTGTATDIDVLDPDSGSTATIEFTK